MVSFLLQHRFHTEVLSMALSAKFASLRQVSTLSSGPLVILGLFVSSLNWCLIDSQITKTAGLAGLEGPAEPSAPTGRRFGRLWRVSRFHLLSFESEVNLLSVATMIGNFILRCQAPDS